MAFDNLVFSIDYLAQTLDHFETKLNSITALSRANANTTVTLNDYLSATDAPQFVAGLRILGLQKTAADAQASAAKGKEVISKTTLAAWVSRINENKNALNTMASMFNRASFVDASTVLGEMNTLAFAIQGVSASPGQARTYQIVSTLSRIYGDLANIAYTRSYEKITAGLGNIIGANSAVVQEWRSNGLTDISPLARLDHLQTKLSNLVGMDLSISTSTFGQNWRTWKEGVLSRLSATAIESSAQNMVRTMRSSGVAVDINLARKTAVEMANYRLETDEIPTLNGTLLNNSQYQKLATRYSTRANAQQFGRFLGSGGSLLFSVPGEFYAAAVTDQKTAATMRAAQYLASGLQVPYSLAFAAIEARINGQKPGKIFNDLVVAYQRSAERVVIGGFNENRGLMGRAEPLNLAQLDVLDAGRLKVIKAAGDTAKFNMNRGKELAKQMGKSAMFLLADILSLANNIYGATTRAPSTGTTEIVERAQLTTNVLADTAFLSGDLLYGMTNGTKAVRTAQGFLVAGASLATVSSIFNFYFVYKKYNGNFSSDAAITDLFGWMINTASTAVAIGVGIACPPAALLFMLVPDLSSAAQAITFQATYDDLKKKGYNKEADAVSTMHLIATLNSVPIVNWFSSFYTPRLSEDMLRTMGPQWYNTAYEDRMKFAAQDFAPKLLDLARQANSTSFHMVTSSKQDFNYFGQSKSISDWVDFGVRAGSTTAVVTTSTKLGALLTPSGILRLPLPFTETPKTSTLGFDAVYQIVQGDGVGMPTLTLDNGLSTLRTLYMNSSVSSARILAGSGDDYFVLSQLTLELDGGAGNNTVSLQLAKAGAYIDMSLAKNISAWKGSAFADIVIGTEGAEIYASNGGADQIYLRGGDDIAAVGANTITDLGVGDDTAIVLDLPHILYGEAGKDTAVFQGMGQGLVYKTLGFQEAAIAANSPFFGGTDPNTLNVGNATHRMGSFESLIATPYNDRFSISSVDSVRTLSLGGGDDYLEIGALSGAVVFTGDGNDQVFSTGEAYSGIWTDGQFYLGGGNDVLNLVMDGTAVLVDGGEGDDNITVSGELLYWQDVAEIVGGRGNDVITLSGDLNANIRLGIADGADAVYDSVARTQSMVLSIDGASSSDVTVTIKKYAGTQMPVNSSDPYAWTIEVAMGALGSSVQVHTMALAPGDIYVVTQADQVAKKIDLMSALTLSTVDAPELPIGQPLARIKAPISGNNRAADVLVQSMAGFAADSQGISAGAWQQRNPDASMLLAASPV